MRAPILPQLAHQLLLHVPIAQLAAFPQQLQLQAHRLANSALLFLIVHRVVQLFVHYVLLVPLRQQLLQQQAQFACHVRACPAGKNSVSSGIIGPSDCVSCLPGTFSTNAGATTASACLPCAIGSYSPISGAATCSICVAGTYTKGTGSTSSSDCGPCIQGHFCTNGIIVPCPEGTYSRAENATSAAACSPCSAGFFSPNSGETSIQACKKCPPGFYSKGGVKFCSPCEQGTFTSNFASVGCEQCGTNNSCGLGSRLQVESKLQETTPNDQFLSKASQPVTDQNAETAQISLIVICICIVIILIIASILLAVCIERRKISVMARVKYILSWIDCFSFKHFVKPDRPGL